MASGAPVVAGDIPALRETGGAAPAYVDPLSVGALGTCLWDVLSDPARQRALREAGLARVGAFSWQATARLTWQQYQAAAQVAA
jgi:glycosyltransferase involved in cell wall biosynthesis